MTENIVYPASRHSENDVKYIGSTENSWKFCFYHHRITSDDVRHMNRTVLFKHFCQSRNGGNTPIITGDIGDKKPNLSMGKAIDVTYVL